MADRPELFAITGMPRAGTTYLAAVLHDPPRVVTLSEAKGAWKSLFEAEGAGADPLPLMRDFRGRIAAGEPIATFDGTPGYDGTSRVDTWSQPKGDRVIPVERGFALGVKNPEVFLAWLPRLLDAGLPVAIAVRHPIGVIASWKKRSGGFADGACVTYRSPAADPVERRIDLFLHFARQIAAVRDLARVAIVRHEDWFTDPAQLARVAAHLGVPAPAALRPAPIAPDPVALPPEERDRILAGCAEAAALGYPLAGDRLASPPALSHV